MAHPKSLLCMLLAIKVFNLHTEGSPSYRCQTVR